MKRALLDANVLFSAHLRDVFLWLAFRRVYEARFSAVIHEEWMRAVFKQRPQTNLESLQKTRDAMNRNIPGALVEGFEPLIETLILPDPNDRHVLAAAIHARCEVIVTLNGSDFPAAARAPVSIALQTPDAFLSELFQLDPQNVLDFIASATTELAKTAARNRQFHGKSAPPKPAKFCRRARTIPRPTMTPAAQYAQYAQKREEAVELIRQHAPTRLQDALIELLRPAIALCATRADDSEIPLGASKFGAAPDVVASIWRFLTFVEQPNRDKDVV